MTEASRLPAVPGRHRPWPRCRRCHGIALDLGSSRTRAWMPGRGLVLDVPTVTFPGTDPHDGGGSGGGGTVRPVRRGEIVDTDGTARMLDRLLGHRLPRFGRPLLVLTAPVIGGVAYRSAARQAAGVLRPRSVLTVPAARAVAVAAGADTARPLLVLDVGAHVTEAVLLSEGTVTDARRIDLGTADLDGTRAAARRITDGVAEMMVAMLSQEQGTLVADALERGVLLAGGGALRPEIGYRLTGLLHASVTPVPAPHTAAVRGAAQLLEAAHTHPSLGGSART